MMKPKTFHARLEHVNLKVRHLGEALRFLQAAFPEFGIRHDEGEGLDRWVHIGTDEYYLALTVTNADKAPADKPYSGYPGVQHLGWAVPDVEGLRQRLLAGGFEESTFPNEHPHRKRVYFYDADGNDWEFVEYLSDDPSERNDYTLGG
ncbi:VOC family protein [bacterium]|nr:VOC family protein [bacterium]